MWHHPDCLPSTCRDELMKVCLLCCLPQILLDGSHNCELWLLFGEVVGDEGGVYSKFHHVGNFFGPNHANFELLSAVGESTTQECVARFFGCQCEESKFFVELRFHV